jgi:hypothetical protein
MRRSLCRVCGKVLGHVQVLRVLTVCFYFTSRYHKYWQYALFHVQVPGVLTVRSYFTSRYYEYWQYAFISRPGTTNIDGMLYFTNICFNVQ